MKPFICGVLFALHLILIALFASLLFACDTSHEDMVPMSEVTQNTSPDPGFTADAEHRISIQFAVGGEPTMIGVEGSTMAKSTYTDDERANITERVQDYLLPFNVTVNNEIGAGYVLYVTDSKPTEYDLAANVLGATGWGCIGESHWSYMFGRIGTTAMSVAMIHELGHQLGLQHAEDTNDVMYPSIDIDHATNTALDDNMPIVNDQCNRGTQDELATFIRAFGARP